MSPGGGGQSQGQAPAAAPGASGGAAGAAAGQDRGQSQSEDRGEQKERGKAHQGAQGKDSPDPRGQREQTTGQGERGQSPGQRPMDAQGQGQRGQDQSQPRTQRDQSQQGQQGQAGGSTTMTTEQRTSIRQTVINSGPRVSTVNFSLSVGTAVPRSVKVVAVPSVLVDVYPQYRGLLYFIVDDQIIIVDKNYKIVAVISV